MRVVLDTNVFVSGIFWHGNCSTIIELLRDERFEAIFSLATLQELERVLRDFHIKLEEDVREQWLSIIRDGNMVSPIEKISACDDPEDNKFLEAAVAGNAAYIVTGDDDLLRLKEFREVKIVTPKEFLRFSTALSSLRHRPGTG